VNERATLPGDARLSFALRLARLGLYIAPLLPGAKTPYSGESWSNMRTRNEDTIIGWFRDRPQMNYAAIPDEEFVVLDLDVKPAKGEPGEPGHKPAKDGVSDLDEIAALNGDFSAHMATLTVRTPSGGVHRYFRAPFAVANSNKLPTSIDVRGHGGYVVGPGCNTVHNPVDNTQEGDYVVLLAHDIMPLPDYLHPLVEQWVPRENRPSYEDSVELRDGKQYVDGVELDTEIASQRALEWLQRCAPAIEGQGGNAKTFATFAWLREHGISREFALQLVKDFYNPRCEPPWSDEALAQLCDNAYRYAKHGVSDAGAVMDKGKDEEDIVAESTDVMALLADMETARVAEQQAVADSLDAHTWCGDALYQRKGEKEFVIPRVLPALGYVGFLARRGTGKTTVMMDMALRLAHDMDWHNRPAKRGWGAIVLAGEDAEGSKDQVTAWKLKHAIERLDPKRFIFMDQIVNLLNPKIVDQWIAHFVKHARGRRFVVFGDTWQLATNAGSQNEDAVMQVAVSQLKRIAHALNGPAVMAAHPPKGDGTTWSGSAVLENHSQALWLLAKETYGLKFCVSRIKGTQADHYTLFSFEPQSLGGKDEWGFPQIGIVPIAIGGEGVESDPVAESHRDAFKQAVADAAHAILLAAEDSGDRSKWTGRRMSEAIIERHNQAVVEKRPDAQLPEKPGAPDTLARNFSSWFNRREVEVTARGPNGTRMAVTADMIGNKLTFRYVQLADTKVSDDEI
jgi:hypothetical protein